MTKRSKKGTPPRKDPTLAQTVMKSSMAGTQTLVRGLEVIDAVAGGTTSLDDLAGTLGLTRSTTHRLASTLVERRYLEFTRGRGYGLGAKLLELGHLAAGKMDLTRVARPYLEELSTSTGDAVHLGVLEGSRALYLDKIQGSRRVEVSSRIGERQPLRSTGLGKALILDADDKQWREYYDYEARLGVGYDVPLESWLARMREYSSVGYAFDLEENEDRIRCVAAPIRGVNGRIAAAISVSSAAQYMDDLRMRGLSFQVRDVAERISTALGYNPATAGRLVAAPKTSAERAAGKAATHAGTVPPNAST
ncbi:MAG: IclR family transcriptional regulator, partial [Steroidobacteraceae bacterium]